MSKGMTPEEFNKARQSLGLTHSQLAHVLGVDLRTIQRWAAGDRAIGGTASRAMGWFLDGIRPPQWPEGKT